MKKTIIMLSVLALLLCSNGCRISPAGDGQHSVSTTVPAEPAAIPNDDHSASSSDDIQYVPPEGDDGIGDQWESLEDFKTYAAESKEDRDYPVDMNIANADDFILVPFKRDYTSEDPWVFRVLEMYRESFDRSWIWYYTQGEKGWIIVKIGKLTQEEYALSQTMTCAELFHEISPIFVQPGDVVEGYLPITEQDITIAENYSTTSIIFQRIDSDRKYIDCVFGEYIVSIADNGGTVDEEWLRNLDFYAIPYVE